MQVAYFGAGCFWGIEDAFRQLNGVISTAVGYSGGTTTNPTYQDVCSGRTGHTEAVEVRFDSDVISYGELLKVFWSLHDASNDLASYKGGQYKSVIFYHDAQQHKEAQASLESEKASGKYRGPITTHILPEPVFYSAEEYHQKYYVKNKGGACSR